MRSSARFIIIIFILVVLIFAYRKYRSRPAPANSASESQSRIGPPDIYPDAQRTPGFANPDITQENLQDTLCNPHWSTKSIRPPERYTEELKVKQIREYEYADAKLRDYEEDHLIPLEVGGNPTDPRNLWPEPYETSIPDGGARFKDKVENYLHEQVCAGNIPLAEAQREIATDWYRVYVTSVKR
jgi:hypothetical protein